MVLDVPGLWVRMAGSSGTARVDVDQNERDEPSLLRLRALVERERVLGRLVPAPKAALPFLPATSGMRPRGGSVTERLADVSKTTRGFDRLVGPVDPDDRFGRSTSKAAHDKGRRVILGGLLSVTRGHAETSQVPDKLCCHETTCKLVRRVPGAGLEPARAFAQRLARSPRLPVSPPRRPARLRTLATRRQRRVTQQALPRREGTIAWHHPKPVTIPTQPSPFRRLMGS
jgi:hypothetical protein